MQDFIFNYGWRKAISVPFMGQNRQIEVILDAYKGEEITSEQTKAYEQYVANQAQYAQKAERLLERYIDENNIEETGVLLKSLYIQREGSFALFCECDWDVENGIAIVLSPKEYVTIQDNFL